MVRDSAMEEPDVKKILEEFAMLPEFEDGRVDYTNSPKAPVVTCFVQVGDEILLLKRSGRVATYQGKWNVVAGYIDEVVSLKKKVMQELGEEIGVGEVVISEIHYGEAYEMKDQSIGKTWVIHPVRVVLSEKPDIMIDWEHTDYEWVKISDIEKYDIVPSLKESLKRVMAA